MPVVKVARDGDPMAQARIHADSILAVQLEQHKLCIQHETEELLCLAHCVVLRIDILQLQLLVVVVVAVVFVLVVAVLVVAVIFALAQRLENGRGLLGLLEQQQRGVELADTTEWLRDDRGLGEEGDGGGLEGDGPDGEEFDEVGREGVAGDPHLGPVFLFLYYFIIF